MRNFSFFLLLFPLVLAAQTKFGYFSYSHVLESVPQYTQAVEDYNLLKQRCDAEINRNEDELTRYYVAFLEGHRDFPEPILRKRQNELQQMIDNSVAFRDQLKSWLAQAHDSLFQSSHRIVEQALDKVCSTLSLAYAIDIDGAVYKYINPKIGIDITGYLIDAVIAPSSFKGVIVDGISVGKDNAATDNFQKAAATEMKAAATDTIGHKSVE